MNLRVVKHEADEEKDVFKIVLKGQATELVDGQLIECELRLKGKQEDIIDKFPRGSMFKVSINAELGR